MRVGSFKTVRWGWIFWIALIASANVMKDKMYLDRQDQVRSQRQPATEVTESIPKRNGNLATCVLLPRGDMRFVPLVTDKSALHDVLEAAKTHSQSEMRSLIEAGKILLISDAPSAEILATDSESGLDWIRITSGSHTGQQGLVDPECCR